MPLDQVNITSDLRERQISGCNTDQLYILDVCVSGVFRDNKRAFGNTVAISVYLEDERVMPESW